MDKRVVFAVAGSGKTRHIIECLEESSRALIVTYTNNNALNLKLRILQKFGHVPPGIRVYTYYAFLYSFCFKPILACKIKARGISWEIPFRFAKKDSEQHYMNTKGYLYGNRIAKLLLTSGSISELVDRVEKYFDFLYIDEVQDFSGNDFDLLCSLAKANVRQLLVGDFFQHTFDTSRDGNVNGKLHDDYELYKLKFSKAGFFVDLNLLSHSYRCSPTICRFISDQLGIAIQSHREDETEVAIVECCERVDNLFKCEKTVKLFYQSSSRYEGFTENWGATKGQNCYDDVCVVLNSTSFKLYKKSSLLGLATQTKNKLYVACTRAKRNLYLVSEETCRKYRK